MTILVTGAAGFIGFHLSERLLKKGFSVFAYDDLNTYYDVKLKESRLNKLYEIKVELNAEFLFRKGSIESFSSLESFLRKLDQIGCQASFETN